LVTVEAISSLLAAHDLIVTVEAFISLLAAHDISVTVIASISSPAHHISDTADTLIIIGIIFIRAIIVGTIIIGIIIFGTIIVGIIVIGTIIIAVPFNRLIFRRLRVILSLNVDKVRRFNSLGEIIGILAVGHA
jgi:hypothetical protein